MTAPLVWIIGEGGLLGKQIKKSLTIEFAEARIWNASTGPFQWDDPFRLKPQLEEAVNSFATAVSESRCAWMIFWCAGAGVIGTLSDVLAVETKSWGELLSLVESLKTKLPTERGFIFFSSSAGGIYGNADRLPLSESSPCNPISDYGRNKLLQENMLRSWANNNLISFLIGRISNLYGPGQKIIKAQGLLSHISLSVIQRRPINIYVPIDTIRDYLSTSDCAVDVLRCSKSLWLQKRKSSLLIRVIKIFASEQSVSIAHIIGIFSRIAGHPLVLSMTQTKGQLQPSKLGFRSEVLHDIARIPKTPLLVGIQRLHSHHLELYQSGKLTYPLSKSS